VMLSAEDGLFYRNIDLTVAGGNLLASWVAWEHEGRESIIAQKMTDGMKEENETFVLESSRYHPGKVKVLSSFKKVLPFLFWIGYKNKKGTLFFSSDMKDSEPIPCLNGCNVGDFSVVAGLDDHIFLAVEIWTSKKTSIMLFCFDGDKWTEWGFKHSASLRHPQLAVSNDGFLLLAWSEYVKGEYKIGSCLFKAGRQCDIPLFGKSGQWSVLPSVACDCNGVFYLSCCVENFCELDNGVVSFHSEIATAKLASVGTHEWQLTGSSCIDNSMNPWMAPYAGRRRFSQLVTRNKGGAFVVFEEKNDPDSYLPGPGRLIIKDVEEEGEKILHEGRSKYTVASTLTSADKLAFASAMQDERYLRYSPPYQVDFCCLDECVFPTRPDKLQNNSKCSTFSAISIVRGKKTFDEYQLFYGDIHVHSRYSGDLLGEQDELYHYAKDIAGLDFIAITENDYVGFTHPMPEDVWEKNKRNANFYNSPGEFTTFVGWEHTLHKIGMDTHRCVITDSDDVPIYSCFEEKYAASGKLEEKMQKERVLLHHHHQFGFDFTDENLERNIEITSGWNSHMLESVEFRKKLHIALDNGFKLGFIGGSDNHQRNPGLGGAITGVWAKSNTRKDIFDALRARRCFATTGIRPDLRFSVCGKTMGEEAKINSVPKFCVNVSADKPIVQIEIIRDGKIIFVSNSNSFEWFDDSCAIGRHYYYIHVVFQGEQPILPWNLAVPFGVHAWSSPVWILK